VAKEHERRFLCKKKLIPANLPYADIQQGYVYFDDTKQIRVRIEKNVIGLSDNSTSTFEKASFAIKFEGTERDEYEYDILLADGKEILAKCFYTLTKRRYTTTHQGCTVHIDDFGDEIIAEIETPTKDHKFIPPRYFGKEVTGIKKHSNIQKAIKQSKFKVVKEWTK